MILEKWRKITFTEQVGNIGSEFSRVRHWQRLGDFGSQKKAIERAIGLIDLTVSVQKKKSRRSELLRLREIMCDLFTGKKNYDISPKLLENYFLPFALKARK